MVKTNRSRRSLDNSQSQNKKSFFSERIFVIFTYSCLAFLAGFLIYGYYVFMYSPPRETLISIDDRYYNAVDISKGLGFDAVYTNNMNTPLEMMLTGIPDVLKNEYILNQFGSQLVGDISEDEIRFKAVKLLKVNEDIYRENSLILDEVLSAIRDKSQISRASILSRAKSSCLHQKSSYYIILLL